MKNNEEILQKPSKEDLDNVQKEQWKKRLSSPGVIQDKNKKDVRDSNDFYSIKAKNNLLGREEYDTSTADKVQKGAAKVADVAYDVFKYSLFPNGTGIYDRALISAAKRLNAPGGAGFLRLLGAHPVPDFNAKEESSEARKKSMIKKGIFGIERAEDGLYYIQDRLIEGQERKILIKLFPQYESQLKKMSPQGLKSFAKKHSDEIEEVLKSQHPEL